MADLLFGPVAHQDAIDFIKKKPPVSRAVFNQLLPELRARAFCVTGIESVTVLQRVRDRIAELPAGAAWDDVKSDLVDDISPFLVNDSAEPEERDRQIVAANRRAELLLRTHGFQAYQSAAYEVADRQRDAFPFWQYMTMEDAQVRPSHAALDGVILPAHSTFWRDHYPPWDWGCRCQVVPISRDDHEDAQKADAKLPADDRMILDDARLGELEQNGRLVRGPSQITNCKSPVAMGKEHAFQWHPGDLRLPLDQLQARYDAPTWAAFLRWAKATDLSAGRTVWDWLDPAPEVTPVEDALWDPLRFGNDSEAKRWADANMHPRTLGLTAGQRASLKNYQLTGFREINRALRTGGPLDPSIAREVARLDGATASSSVPANLTVYRGLQADVVKHLDVGVHFEETAFLSSSLSADIAQARFGGGAVLEIRVPVGADAMYMDALVPRYAHKLEILFPRGTLLTCVKREMRDETLWLTMEIV